MGLLLALTNGIALDHLVPDARHVVVSYLVKSCLDFLHKVARDHCQEWTTQCLCSVLHNLRNVRDMVMPVSVFVASWQLDLAFLC